MNREEVLEVIEPLTQLQVRNIEHSPRTRVTVAPDMVVLRPGGGARMMQMAEGGVKSMAKFAGLPVDLVKQISPDLFGRLATELLQRKRVYSIMLQEGQIVEFGKPMRTRTINPERVVKIIEDNVHDADFYRVMTMPNHSVSLEVVGMQRKPVARGDLVQAGALVAFSPIGTIEPSVHSYVMRLVCTNGATTHDIVREFHFGGGGDGDNIWQFFRQSVRDAYQSIDIVIGRWRNMIQDKIAPADRAMMLEALLKQSGIAGRDADAVRARALEEPPRNTYEMMNLITWASSHLLEGCQAIRHAQTVASDFAREVAHRRVCPVCHRQN